MTTAIPEHPATDGVAHPVGRRRAGGNRPFLIVHRRPGKERHFFSVGEIPLEDPVNYLLEKWPAIRPDVIHAHDFEAFQVGLMLRTAFRKPLVFTVHRTPKESDPTLPQRDVKSLFLNSILHNHLVDKLIAPSNAYMNHLLQVGFPASQVKRIYHGVPVKKLIQLRTIPAVLERLRLAPDDELILAPIRLDPHKGPDVFLQAAQLVKLRFPDRRLVFAIAGSGSPKYRARLEHDSRASGVYDFVRLGAEDGKDFAPQEMPTLYRRAKLCVLPSSREGFGLVLLEAAVFRTPVIASNTGGVPEVITPLKTGLLFNRGEPGDLAKQINFLLENENIGSILAAEALSQVQRKFDAELMAREYLQLYQEVAGISLK